MKYLQCQGNDSKSKYYTGRSCYEEVLVEDNIVAAVCWKCVQGMMPAPQKHTHVGYPRGWKFMSEFVDKDGNVFHKGEEQPKLFGKLPPTEIKPIVTKAKPKKPSIEDKIEEEFSKRVTKKRKSNKRSGAKR